MTNQLFRDYLDGRIPMPAKPSPPTLADAFQSIYTAVRDVYIEIHRSFLPIIESLQDLGVIETPPPTDPRARALWAKENRGHGPTIDDLRRRGRVTRYRTKG